MFFTSAFERQDSRTLPSFQFRRQLTVRAVCTIVKIIGIYARNVWPQPSYQQPAGVTVQRPVTVVRRPLPFVLQPEIIVVQSLGMGRWLSLQLAKEQGICANVQFPFPRRFLSDVFRVALPETPEGRHFDREIMTWRVDEYSAADHREARV